MGRRVLIPMLGLLLLLSACGGEGKAPEGPDVSGVSDPSAGADTQLPSAREDTVEDTGLVAQLGLSHFSTVSFPEGEGTEKEVYSLPTDGDEAMEVTVLRGAAEGKTIYVVGGVHGDEPAGWLAGGLLKEAGLRGGTVYVLSPANPYGAQELQRKTREGWDLNRAFPGGAGSSDAQRLAAAIYADIADKQPDLVLDLHEARPWQGERDSLGNSVICHSLEDTGPAVLALLTRTETGELCSGAFTLYGGPPVGSLNRTVTMELAIPVITVETDRVKSLETRVSDQLEVAGFLLGWYGLC